MAVIKYLRKVEFLHHLIQTKSTGSRGEFAKKAGMSKSMLSLYLTEMKELGFPIRYDRCRCTYYYEYDGGMVKSLFGDDRIRLDQQPEKIFRREDVL